MPPDEIVPKQPESAPSLVPEEGGEEAERAEAVQPVASALEARVAMVHDTLPVAQPKEGAPEASPAVPPKAPETLLETPAETPGFTDQVLAIFGDSKERGRNTFMASIDALLFAVTTGGSAIWKWFEEFFGNLFGSKKSEEIASGEGQTTGKPEVQNWDASRESHLAEAKKQLKEAFTKNPTLLDFAKEASGKYGIPVATILAIARFESGGFDPNDKNLKSPAEGLGQFMPETWAQFLGENPEFEEASPSDPAAALFAIAWYCKTNAQMCDIDLNSPTAPTELYLAHHEGPGAYKKLKAFQKGELAGGQMPPVPETYKDNSYSDFGVLKVDTYHAYATLVTRMADRVQAVANEYTGFLPTLALPTS